MFACVAQEIHRRKRAKGSEREGEEASHHTQKKTKYKSLVLSGKQALVHRHPLATRTCASPFYRPGQDEADIRLRIVRLFVFAKCFFFCLNQYQCKRLRRLITATRSAHFALTGDRRRMINALHCGVVRWRVNND